MKALSFLILIFLINNHLIAQSVINIPVIKSFNNCQKIKFSADKQYLQLSSTTDNPNYIYLLDSMFSNDTEFGLNWGVYMYNKKGDIRFINSWASLAVEYNYNTLEVIYTDFDSVTEFRVYSKKIQNYPQWDTISMGSIDLRDILKYDSLHRLIQRYSYGMNNYLNWSYINQYNKNGDPDKTILLDENYSINGYIYRFFNPNHKDTVLSIHSKSANSSQIHPTKISYKTYDNKNRLTKQNDYTRNLYDSTKLYLEISLKYQYDTLGNINRIDDFEPLGPNNNFWSIDQRFYRKKGILDSSYYSYGQTEIPDVFKKTIHYYSSPGDTLPDSTIYCWKTPITTLKIYKIDYHTYDSHGNETLKLSIYFDNGNPTRTKTINYYYSLHKIEHKENSDENTNSDYKVYPVPFTDYITISSSINKPSPFDFYLIDLTGRIVFSKHYNNLRAIKINTNTFSSGIYFYNIISENGETQKGKIVKL